MICFRIGEKYDESYSLSLGRTDESMQSTNASMQSTNAELAKILRPDMDGNLYLRISIRRVNRLGCASCWRPQRTACQSCRSDLVWFAGVCHSPVRRSPRGRRGPFPGPHRFRCPTRAMPCVRMARKRKGRLPPVFLNSNRMSARHWTGRSRTAGNAGSNPPTGWMGDSPLLARRGSRCLGERVVQPRPVAARVRVATIPPVNGTLRVATIWK